MIGFLEMVKCQVMKKFDDTCKSRLNCVVINAIQKPCSMHPLLGLHCSLYLSIQALLVYLTQISRGSKLLIFRKTCYKDFPLLYGNV